MDDITGNLFSLFCSSWYVVLNMFETFFHIKQVKAKKKLSKSCFQNSKKNGEIRTKIFFNDLTMPKLEEIFTTVAIVCHHYERLAVLRTFSLLFCIE